MTDAQRGNTKHGPALDEQMEHETRGMVQGNSTSHVEPFRETEPLPDDTDTPDVQRAFGSELPADAANEQGGKGDA
jgi:hypothetical protein